VSIVLTAEGQDICNKTFRRESVKQVFSGLSDEEREELQGSLIKLRDKALKDRGVRNTPPFPTADS
jgi:DNA-binding MarR family transcriptional regulator